MACGCWLEAGTHGGSGADGGDLDHSEQAAGADRQASGHPLQVHKHFTACIIWEVSQTKTFYCVNVTLEKSNMIFVKAKWMRIRCVDFFLVSQKKMHI